MLVALICILLQVMHKVTVGHMVGGLCCPILARSTFSYVWFFSFTCSFSGSVLPVAVNLFANRGTFYGSFKEAWQVRELAGDDSEWFHLFDESIQWASSFRLRHLFMTVLLLCGFTNESRLLDKYWRYIADDLASQIAVFG
jgi:hypothetical protein